MLSRAAVLKRSWACTSPSNLGIAGKADSTTVTFGDSQLGTLRAHLQHDGWWLDTTKVSLLDCNWLYGRMVEWPMGWGRGRFMKNSLPRGVLPK